MQIKILLIVNNLGPSSKCIHTSKGINERIKQLLLFCLLGTLTFSFAQERAIFGVNNGGNGSLGTIFKTDLNGENYTILHELKYTNPGAQPDNSSLCEVKGTLYGTTGDGGEFENGVLYAYHIATETYTKLHDFEKVTSGRSPYSNVILAKNGKLYGTTLYGGLYDLGTLFEYDIASKTLTKKLDFDGVTMGQNLYANVIQGSDGKLYGLTNRGGTYGQGVLFSYDYTTESFSTLFNFDGDNTGVAPTILVEVAEGTLYGTTSGGGADKSGTLFKYSIDSNTFEKKFDFARASTGGSPSLSLTIGTNGNLYGLTRDGGVNNRGVIYEYNIALESYTKKFDLTLENGNTPTGKLIEVGNNKFMGLTNLGGSNNDGVIFEFDIQTNTYTKKFDFELSSAGKNPKGSFVMASNGKLYATAEKGGYGLSGTLYQYDFENDSFEKKIDFNYAENGKNFKAGFAKGNNGKLYITTSAGGNNLSYGTLLEYNPSDNTLLKNLILVRLSPLKI